MPQQPAVASGAVTDVKPASEPLEMPAATGTSPGVGALPEAAKPSEAFGKIQGTLGEHKGKLAIGVAATLGLMIFYKWREKKLAQEDPQEYARLQRIKHGVQADLITDKRSTSGARKK